MKMRYNHKRLLAILTVLFLTSALIVANGGGAYAAGGTFPASPFNGMQTTYSFSGATITSSADSEGFTYSRTLKGNLGTGQLRVSGSAKMGSGYYADVVVRVWAGSEQQEWTARIPTGYPGFNSRSFDVAVDIPDGATSGGFSIDMTGMYNAGTRGVVVRGDFAGAPAGVPPPTATPAPPKPAPTAPPAPVAIGKPVLKVNVTAPDSVNAGGDITYRIEVSNVGNGAAPDTWFKWYARWDSAAEGAFTQQGSPFACHPVSGGTTPEIVCGPGTLQAGQTATAEVTLKAPAEASSVGGEVLAQAACEGDNCYAAWGGKTSITALISCNQSLEDQVRRSNELYLRSFEGTCLGQIVSLGDAGTFRNAMEGVQVQQDASYTPSYLDGRIRLQVRPCDGNLEVGAGPNETAWHETVHRLEQMNGDFDSADANVEGYADRNADYVTAIGPLLNGMRNLEAQARKGASAEQLGRVWQRLQESFVKGNTANPFAAVPDLDQLQRWTGFRARIDEIRNVYLSGCAGEAMKQAVLSVPEPPPYISPGGLTVGAPAAPEETPITTPAGEVIVPDGGLPPGDDAPAPEGGPFPEDIGPGETPVEF